MPSEKPVLVRLELKDYSRLEKVAEKNHRSRGAQGAVYILEGLDREKA